MNPYAARLSKFEPRRLVANASVMPAAPGQAVGNEGGLQDGGEGVFVAPGTASTQQQVPTVTEQNPFAGDPAAALGGPLQAPQGMNNPSVGGYYRNEYGTEIKGNYNPVSGRIEGAANIPIGDYRKGYSAGVSGYYSPNNQFGGADYGVGLSFGKRNNPPPPGTLPSKYEMGITFDNKRGPKGVPLNPMQKVMPGQGMPHVNSTGQISGQMMGTNLNRPAISPEEQRLMIQQMQQQEIQNYMN